MTYTLARTNSTLVRRILKNGVLRATTIHNVGFVRSGQAVVNRRELIKAGQQAGSDYTLTANNGKLFVGTSNVSFGILQQANPPVYSVVNNSLSGSYRAPIWVDLSHKVSKVEVDAKALSLAHKRVREQTSHWNGITAVGELRETIRMLKRPFSGMRNAFIGYINRVNKLKTSARNTHTAHGRKALTRAVSDTWLEVAFGIKPLLSDTKAIAESIARFQFEPPKRARIRVSSRQQFAYPDDVLDPTPLNYDGNMYMLLAQIEKVKVEYSCQYIVGMQHTQIADFNSTARLIQILGFTPENFVPTLWELVPWSFVVDYFTNVGDIVEAATTDQTDVLWNVCTRVGTTTRSLTTTAPSPQKYIQNSGYKYFSHSGNYGGYETVSKSVQRVTGGKLGIPSLVLSYPESIGKVTNLLALFAGRLNGIFPQSRRS